MISVFILKQNESKELKKKKNVVINWPIGVESTEYVVKRTVKKRDRVTLVVRWK